MLLATQLITGCVGGNVVLDPPEKPTRILIMDTPDIATAQNVWQWNQNGLGHSSSGVNGTYTTAWTIDGHFNADFIDTETLMAGILTNNASSDFYLVPGDVTIGGRVERGILGYLRSYSTTTPLFSLTCNRTTSLNLSYVTLKMAGMIFQGIAYDSGSKFINIETGDSLLTMGKNLSYLATRVNGVIKNMIATSADGVYASSDGGTTKKWLT